MIFIGQKIEFNTTFTENGSALDISGGIIEYDYWLPGNYTTTPDDTIIGSVVNGASGTATADFPAILNTSPGSLRVQAALTLSGDKYRASTTCVTIYPIGAGG